MSRLFRQAELLKSVTEWVKMGFTVMVTPDGIKVMPKTEAAPADEFADVRMK